MEKTRTIDTLRATVRSLDKSRSSSVPRIGLDLLMWWGAAHLALTTHNPWLTAAVIAFLGAIPMHDILVHGHEATHRLISPVRWINEFFLWFTHALMGLSGSGYRAFHLDHHAHTHTDEDPEIRLLRRRDGSVPGWAYLLIPLVSHWEVATYPILHPSRRANARTVASDLIGVGVLHAGLVTAAGLSNYLLFVLAPIFTSLSLVIVARSLCEHHYAIPGDRWTRTRTMLTHPALEFLWSNVNHHLEHHLFPTMPYYQLPTVRRLLSTEYVANRSIVDAGYVRTAASLFFQPEHFRRSHQS